VLKPLGEALRRFAAGPLSPGVATPAAQDGSRQGGA